MLTNKKDDNGDQEEPILPVDGITIGTAASGVRYQGRLDLAIFEIASQSKFLCFFTQNKFAAAPVELAKRNLRKRTPKYLIVNSGNANAGTGQNGIDSAYRVCEFVAQEAACQLEEVLPFSTGVIGEQLDDQAIIQKIPQIFSSLRPDGWQDAANAIITTDTFPKIQSREIDFGEESQVVTGICKGSGMIKPNMATMLAYVATDACCSQEILQFIGEESLERSFNRITVDGETSTNDAFVLISTGCSRSEAINSKEDPRYQILFDAVSQVCIELAKDIVRDGEGATKLVSVEVIGARCPEDALAVAYSVAESSLVKTAFFAEDPNWGRILSAVGASGISDIDIEKVDILIGDQRVATNGALDVDYEETRVSSIMKEKEFDVRINLNSGNARDSVWTCDLSYEYVRINSEYRS